MDLLEISQYPHKIYKINITNDNNVKKSLYEKIIIKINIGYPDKKSKEIIRFSKERNSGWIDHKQSNDDYFLLIDNVEGISTIYAHFFMNDLYEYEEPDMDILYEYDLEELYNDIQSNNQDIKYNQYNYDMYLTDDKKIKVQSILNNSIEIEGDTHYNNHKNPNYKNYTNIISDNETISNSTEKGIFPIVSRYRNDNDKNDILSAPDIKNKPSTSWHTMNDDFPYWEIHINKNKFGSIMQNDTDYETFPLNVHLNYQYLDTSTEYHQHFFGFESNENTECKDFNVFDSKDINTVNNHFGESHDYRIINYGDKTNSQYNIDYSHIETIELDFNDVESYSCEWEKNLCPGNNYWRYSSIDNNSYADLTLELEKNKEYTLKYYIWIPTETQKQNDDCYISIKYIDEENEEKFFDNINHIFKEQDNVLHNEWIYHEFSFITKTEINTIHIKGPQTPNNTIYFMYISLEHQKQYSPTLKYTQNNLFLNEGNKTTYKPMEEYKDCVQKTIPKNTSSWVLKKDFPIPYDNVRIKVGDETNIIYDEKTTTLSWYNGVNSNFYIQDFNSYKDDELVWFNDIAHGDYMEYDKNSTILTLNRNIEKPLTYGLNNYINLTFTDNNNNPINIGEVSCAISTSKNIDNIIEEYKFLGTKKVNHIVTFDKLDFRKLDRNENYYLRIDYKHPCYKKTIKEYRLLYFEEENISMYVDIIPENGEPHTISTNINNQITTDTYTIQVKEEFPLKINAYLFSQVNKYTTGYCEMSINDKKFSTTFVDDEGYADFYLNYKDIKDNDVIKIEFFDNEENVSKYCYFKIKINSQYDKPVIPIRTRILNNDKNIQNNNTFEIPAYGCLLLDIDTEDEVNFSIQVYKDEKRIYFENVIEKKNHSIIIGDTDGNIDDDTTTINKSHIYTIITDNIKKTTKEPLIDTLLDADNTYRPYSKTINISYIHQKQND